MDDQSSRDVSDRPSNGTQYPRPPVPARRPNYLLSSNVAPQETQAPTSAIRARARPPSAPFLQRHRLRRRREEEETLSYGINSVQDAVNQLQEASSNLSTLLAEPIPRIMTPDMYVDEYTGEAAVNRQRSKRRKLDIPAIRQGFRYGYRGQVVPGPLKMSIVSCDGGQLAHCMGDHQTYYRPENILRNDLSVYCTQKSETSIILRHFVETPFCLTKLVIKSPATGFTAPVSEGMIFVSMNSEGLLSRTAHYHLRESPPNSPVRSTQANHSELSGGPGPQYTQPSGFPDSHLHTLRYGYYPPVNTFDNRPPSRRADYPSARTVPASQFHQRPRLSLGQSASEPSPDSNTSILDRAPSVFSFHHYSDDSATPRPTDVTVLPLQFNVETSCDDPSGDEEESTERYVMEDRTHRAHRIRPSSSDEDEEEERQYLMRRRVPRFGPREIEWRGERPVIDGNTEGREGEGMLVPHARFFIEYMKNAVTVKFDPPVSGKFILIKMWGPAPDRNIDVQSIIPYGYAGPRYFPAVQAM